MNFTDYDVLLMVRFITGGMWLIQDSEYLDALDLIRPDTPVAYCYLLAMRGCCKKYELGVESEQNTFYYKKVIELVEKWLKESEETKEWLYVLVAHCIKMSRQLIGFGSTAMGKSQKHRLMKMRDLWSRLYQYAYEPDEKYPIQ